MLYLHCEGIVCGDQGDSSAIYAEIIPHCSAPHSFRSRLVPFPGLTAHHPLCYKDLQMEWRGACRSIPAARGGKAWTCLVRPRLSLVALAVSGEPSCGALLSLAPMW